MLTDEDIDAIADVLEVRLVERFYSNLGQGVWGLAKKGAIMALLALAAYGAFTEIGPPK
jgi:hypothetical protein